MTLKPVVSVVPSEVAPPLNSAKPAVAIRADIIIDALTEAREKPFDQFRRDEQAWLSTNLGSIARAIELLFSRTIQEHDTDTADAALLGALLGGAIIRSLVEQGAVELETLQANVQTWNIGLRGFRYEKGDEISQGEVTQMYGAEAMHAFEEIRHPASRDMCELVIGTTLWPTARRY